MLELSYDHNEVTSVVYYVYLFIYFFIYLSVYSVNHLLRKNIHTRVGITENPDGH